jgi:CPA2 family monovalent cation:H+ antiporter-2
VALLSLLGFVVLAVIAAAVLPQALRRLHGESDLFLIVCIAAGLSVAGLGAVVFGIPLALAAFVGGLTITESGEAAEARRRLRPFRDVFAVLFFVAIGTLLDPNALLGSGLGWVVLLIGLLLGGKTLVAYVLARLAKLPRPLQVSIGLSQVGEFSFVLGTLLLASGRIPGELHAALLAVVILSIAFSAVAARLPIRGWRPEVTAESA